MTPWMRVVMVVMDDCQPCEQVADDGGEAWLETIHRNLGPRHCCLPVYLQNYTRNT